MLISILCLVKHIIAKQTVIVVATITAIASCLSHNDITSLQAISPEVSPHAFGGDVLHLASPTQLYYIILEIL